MVSAVDTNIFLDILIPNQPHVQSSLKKLESASAKGKIIVCEIVYTELASQFGSIGELNTFFRDTSIDVVWSNKESLFQASRLWQDYLSRHSRKGFCPDCGKRIEAACPMCGSELSSARRILNDFIIGAHAQTFADAFLTRDRGFYRKYFSDMNIV